MRITNKLSREVENLSVLSKNIIKAESILNNSNIIFFDGYKIEKEYVEITIIISSKDVVKEFYVRKAFIEICKMQEYERNEFDNMIMIEYRYNY